MKEKNNVNVEEEVIDIPKEEKINLVNSKMKNIAREMFNLGLNLKMYEAYGEKEEVVEATKRNMDKQRKAHNALKDVLDEVNKLEK